MTMNAVNPFSLQGKVAVVTGANTGLGQAMALALARAEADVVAVARSSAADTVATIEAMGRRAYEVSANLADKGSATAVVDAALLQAGRIDILVNNAGIIKRADAVDFTEADWEITLDVNVKAPFFLAQAAARSMLRQGGGKIINIVSMLAFQGGIRTASYTASKSALAGITRLLANEWAAKGINVNAIAPGYFATNNTSALRADEQRNKDILARIPAGRWGQPSDLDGAVVFLASPASDYVHGTILPVDGGWLAR
jgi:2-dehydro-3-deoxy-D-gluconate 5-dehydrogenase